MKNHLGTSQKHMHTSWHKTVKKNVKVNAHPKAENRAVKSSRHHPGLSLKYQQINITQEGVWETDAEREREKNRVSAAKTQLQPI